MGNLKYVYWDDFDDVTLDYVDLLYVSDVGDWTWKEDSYTLKCPSVYTYSGFDVADAGAEGVLRHAIPGPLMRNTE